MAYLFPSPAWVDAFKDALNASAAYKVSAAHWEGDFYFIVSAKGALQEPVKFYLDLWHGQCRDAYIVEGADDKTPEFEIEGTLDVFRQIFEHQLDPIRALVSRKLKLKGNLGKIMRSVKATLDLVNAAASVDTTYPGE
ncbi:MAG: SCP2 sterol-binding domain-containing protein [Caldilineales bacterium]|nr:SCP2 sterol-binding domain-containing protein [Caldilineales bacterium]